MSYQKQNCNNPMNAYFSRLRDFYLLVPKLKNAKTLRTFELWLDKLIRIDRRSLVLWLRAHQKEIPKEHWEKALARLHQLEDL